MTAVPYGTREARHAAAGLEEDVVRTDDRLATHQLAFLADDAINQQHAVSVRNQVLDGRKAHDANTKVALLPPNA